MTVKKEKSKRSNAGRKWFDGKDEQLVLAKLDTAWSLDCTDAEASAYADISSASLSRYLSAHPNISERKAQLKERPVLAARHTLVEAIRSGPGKEGNPELALKYLERKRKAEFSTRTELDAEVNVVPTIRFIRADDYLKLKRAGKLLPDSK